MGSSGLRLLIVDDCEDDAALVARQFARAGYEVDYVCLQTESAMAAALDEGSFDAVIADVTMPHFSAGRALEVYKARGVDRPFLVVSGVVGEENAVALLKAGAHDFVLKSRLARLVPAFERERREAAGRRAQREAETALRKSEERYALAELGSKDGLWDWDLASDQIYFSPRWCDIAGLAADEPAPTPSVWLERIHPEDRDTVLGRLDDHLGGRSSHFAAEHRLRQQDGGYRWVSARGVAVPDAAGNWRMAGSLTDITAAKDAELLLRDANAKLQSAIEAKTRFLAAASHDMRQPVQALFFFAAALAERMEDDDGAREVLADLQGSLGSLSELLDALLDVSRIDAGMVKAEKSVVALGAVLARVATEMAPVARAKGLRLRMVPTGLSADSDPALLARMLRNLVQNAIRYTERGGVLLGCRRRGAAVHLEVWDTGIGISAENIGLIFEEFFQVGNHERDRRRGLGLGLAIVSRLARMLDHTVSVDSRPSRGSRFSVVLPLSAADA